MRDPRALGRLCSHSLCSLAILVFAVEVSLADELSFDACFALDSSTPRAAITDCEGLLGDNNGLSLDDQTKLYIHIAMLYGQRDEFAQASEFLDEALISNPALYEQNLYRYNWLRQRGIIEIRQHNYGEALPIFNDALRIVQALGRDRMMATVYNDLGTVHRALGQYTESLSAFERALDQYKNQPLDYRTGLAQANIAAVYRDMGNFGDALLYLDRALESHETSLLSTPENEGWISGFIAHVHEDQADTLMAMGRGEEAFPHLLTALELYTTAGRTAEQARVKVLQARLDADAGRLDQALGHLIVAQRLEQQLESTSVIELRPMLAEVLLRLGRYDQAESAAREGLALTQEKEQAQLSMALLETLARIHEASGRPDLALERMRQFIALRESQLQEQYDRDFSVLRANIEIDEQRRANALLEKDNEIAALTLNRQRLLLFAAVLVLGLMAVLLVWSWRQKRADRRRLQTEIAFHRDELDQMVASSQQQLAILDRTADPLVCIDESGRILYHNPTFSQWLAKPPESLIDQSLGILLPELFVVLTESLTGAEADGGDPMIDDQTLTIQGQRNHCKVWLSRLDSRDGFHVVVIQPREDQPDGFDRADSAHLKQQLSILRQFKELGPKLMELMDQLPEARRSDLSKLLNALESVDHSSQGLVDTGPDDGSTDYQQALVSLMLAAVETWEDSTGQTRIELAEQSGIWLVAIDDGRLRTRTLDRYLSVQRLPSRPRWRQVVRTCRYVLIHCRLNVERRERLNERLEAFLKLERQKALSG
ncbi:MAG: tetratricopeptide repeat protein [Pseudomonadota bacterium]